MVVKNEFFFYFFLAKNHLLLHSYAYDTEILGADVTDMTKYKKVII